MAAPAANAKMFAAQGVGCMTVVIEYHGFPLVLDVAVAAQFAVGTFMRIVFFVTGITSSRSFILVEAACMAALAFGCGMHPLQCIRCVAIMAETDELPAFFPVTGVA